MHRIRLCSYPQIRSFHKNFLEIWAKDLVGAPKVPLIIIDAYYKKPNKCLMLIKLYCILFYIVHAKELKKFIVYGV